VPWAMELSDHLEYLLRRTSTFREGVSIRMLRFQWILRRLQYDFRGSRGNHNGGLHRVLLTSWRQSIAMILCIGELSNAPTQNLHTGGRGQC